MVFDGRPLPAKKGTELRRRQSRKENGAIAMKLVQQGRHGEAFEYFAKAVDVSPELAYQFIKVWFYRISVNAPDGGFADA